MKRLIRVLRRALDRCLDDTELRLRVTAERLIDAYPYEGDLAESTRAMYLARTLAAEAEVEELRARLRAYEEDA